MKALFNEKITVKDEWETQGEKFRLVDKGVGPMELQTINPHTNDVDWKPERDHYVHGVLCARIVELSNDKKRKSESVLIVTLHCEIPTTANKGDNLEGIEKHIRENPDFAAGYMKNMEMQIITPNEKDHLRERGQA